jgi:hypothetical protein
VNENVRTEARKDGKNEALSFWAKPLDFYGGNNRTRIYLLD